MSDGERSRSAPMSGAEEDEEAVLARLGAAMERFDGIDPLDEELRRMGEELRRLAEDGPA